VPEPVVVHVIGTTVLLSATLLIIASVTIVQTINYYQTLSAMLSEAAESCAREIVELVSVHTLGGEELTYMILTLPQSLGGQPYNLTLENVRENMIAVKAQLQIHRQVRIVVTPNFGQAPVYAVQEPTKFGDLVLSPTILLPTPYGWKAALVAVRKGDTILIGFTTQPPTIPHSLSIPNFKLVNWTLRLEGLAGSKQTFTFAVWNSGSEGTATVNVYDSNGGLVGSTAVSVGSKSVAWGQMTLTLPFTRGSYVWRIDVVHNGHLYDSRTFEVASKQPQIVISGCDPSVSGPPSSTVRLNVTIVNVGDYDGEVQVSVNTTLLGQYSLSAGQKLDLTFDLKLPDTLGSYTWLLSVKTLETGYVDERWIPVKVRDPDAPYIDWINTTIDGLVGWSAKICVRVSNPSATSHMVSFLLNGTPVGTGEVPANGYAWFNFTAQLPSKMGVYRWNVSLVSSNVLLDARIIELSVKDFVLLERTAVLYNTFDSGVLPSDWAAAGGIWQAAGSTLQGTDQSNQNTKDGFCSVKQVGKQEKVERCAVVYYWQGDASSYVASRGVFAALVQVLIDANDNDVSRGFVLLKEHFDLSSGPLYTMTLYRASNKSAWLRVESFNGDWSLLDPGASVGRVQGSYTLFLSITYTGYSVALTYDIYSGDSSLLGAPRSFSVVDTLLRYIGLLVSQKTGTFDNIVLATGDPRYVAVRGLPPSWTVELYSGQTLIAREVSDGVNEIRFLVTRTPILGGAWIRIIDPYGREWRRLSFDTLVGGDSIVFSVSKD